MKNIIELELKAIDFKDTDFYEPCNCAISKAVKRQLGINNVDEGVFYVHIEGIKYNHKSYCSMEFNPDIDKAILHNFDNTTIRTITLTKA